MRAQATLMPLLLPVPDACRVLGVRKSTLYALLRSERLRAVKLGRRTLVCAESVRALVLSLPPAGRRQEDAAR